MCVYIYIYVHMYVYTYIYIYIYIYTHTTLYYICCMHTVYTHVILLLLLMIIITHIRIIIITIIFISIITWPAENSGRRSCYLASVDTNWKQEIPTEVYLLSLVSESNINKWLYRWVHRWGQMCNESIPAVLLRLLL